MKGDRGGVVNQQKKVHQETAYSVVVVNDHMFFHVSMTPFGSQMILGWGYICSFTTTAVSCSTCFY